MSAEIRSRSLRSEVEEQAKRAALLSTFQPAPVSLYVIRERGITRATIVGHSISEAHPYLVRLRGGKCRRVCGFHSGRKTA